MEFGAGYVLDNIFSRDEGDISVVEAEAELG